MNKTNQFNVKTQYVAPSCKSVNFRSKRTILTGSVTGGEGSLENMNSKDTSSWNWDSEE